MSSPDETPGAAEVGSLIRRSGRSGLARWLKPAVTIALYVLVFYWTDAREIPATLRNAQFGLVGGCVALYIAGQSISALKWRLLLAPVGLSTPYPRLLGFYFTGMFFNLFLPTIVGGDAVKAVLLARETGAPARATMSVFMERNTGLCALLLIALVAAFLAPPVTLYGISLVTLTWLLAAGYVVVNVVLFSPHAYRITDGFIARSPLRRIRARAASLYEAAAPYTRAIGVLVPSILLSIVFQFVVIGVVFLSARALSLSIPFTAVAVFVPLVSLAGMVPVSVNGLGVREALYILLFGRIGIPAELAVSLALLYLGVTIAASLPGGLVYALQKSPGRLTAEAAPDLH
jgi:glycosyltransferase 2 family protein